MHQLPHVVGLDLSLTRTGIATAGADTRHAHVGQDGITTLPLHKRTDAIVWLGEQIELEWLWGGEWPDLVMIEAPDVSRGYGGLVERVSLYHEVCSRLIKHEIPFGTVPSPVLKGYATGNGGHAGGKKRIIDAVKEVWPEYGTEIKSDEADAIILANMGLHRLVGRGRVDGERETKWLLHASNLWPSELRTRIA